MAFISGVEGHWDHPHNRPWAPCDENVKEGLAHLVGAKSSEVTAMGTLTANLHTMMAAFYRPTTERYKIVIEAKAFPSDHVNEFLFYCLLFFFIHREKKTKFNGT